MRKWLGFGLGAVLFASSLAAYSATIPTLTSTSTPSITSCSEASQMAACVNQLIGTINTQVTPQSMATWGSFRNFLDNGSISVFQRGTGIQTGATTSAAVAANYAADRWLVDTNVTSGAGRGQVTTSTPTPPVGFTNSMRLYRTSGALTQPVCAWQAVPTADATDLAGRQVTFSVQMQALAGLIADNAGAVNLFIIFGTGTDQGFASWTASPAITPAWTGINSSITAAVTITTTWARYSVSGNIPLTATEIGVGICFTPTATGAGTTDGLAFTGAQLEDGAVASAFEMRPLSIELLRAQRFYYEIDESAAIFPVAPCSAVDTTHTNCLVQFPVTMFKAPTMTYATGFASPTSTTQATLGNCTTLASAATVTSTVAGTQNVLVNCTATTIPAAGVASFLYSNNGTGKIIASADF